MRGDHHLAGRAGNAPMPGGSGALEPSGCSSRPRTSLPWKKVSRLATMRVSSAFGSTFPL